MPEELAGEAVRLVGRLAGRANWRGYGWIDDAQADALWRIVAYSHGYDQSRGAWSSWALRVAWTSFLKRCNLERRHDQIKVDLQRETPAERDEAAREYAAGLMRRWRLSG
jgi:DNA-directed RNA polymerase specialized sigma24 family protein